MSGYALYRNIQHLKKIFVPVVKDHTKLSGWMKDHCKIITEDEPLQHRDVSLANGLSITPDTTPAFGDFDTYWDKDMAHAVNNGIDSGVYNVAKMVGDKIVTGEINYHPDSSQIFLPRHNKAYYMFLAPRGSAPLGVVALKLRGVGVHISPGIWHQPPIMAPGSDSSGVFYTCQLRSHNCVNHVYLDDDELIYFNLK